MIQKLDLIKLIFLVGIKILKIIFKPKIKFELPKKFFGHLISPKIRTKIKYKLIVI
jgi:hypothetical protein